jgi:O-6-methylguanine DNA methyltransferase
VDFRTRVHTFVRSVPRGRVVTYADVALAVGCPGGARAVGRVMAQTDDRSVPCHRVVRSDGRVAGSPGLAARLRREAVRVGRDGRIADFAARRWT